MSLAAIGVDGVRCACIGEIGNAHNGSLDNALRLMDGLKAAGAAAAKLQCYLPEELVALRGDGPAPAQWSHMTMRELYSRAATPFGWFETLYNHGRDIGLPVFSSVFGAESLALLESLGNPVYKVARLDHEHEWLATLLASSGKPLIVSHFEGDRIADAYEDATVLLCHPGYPSKVTWLPKRFEAGAYFGLSSHCLDPDLPIAAVARGAKLLEYHVQLDDTPSELEANVSLTVTQFAEMVRRVRNVEEMLG